MGTRRGPVCALKSKTETILYLSLETRGRDWCQGVKTLTQRSTAGYGQARQLVLQMVAWVVAFGFALRMVNQLLSWGTLYSGK
jgi:hypothetical protein